jgi:hypothetical protein
MEDASDRGRAVNPSRRGSLIAATWLIGLGTVFLIREAANWSWGEAWPLFVILSGVAGGVSVAVSWRRGGIWAFTWPIAWTLVGVVLLASTTGKLSEGPGELIGTWWPLAAIGLGIWFLLGAVFSRGSGTDQLVIPLEGSADAEVRIKFGAGRLTTGRADPGNLVDGRFDGGVQNRRHGANRIELARDFAYGVPWLDHSSQWTVGLTGDVPLDLRLETGASRAVLDLTDLKVRSLELKTGASETRVILPRAAGITTVKAEAGAASLVIEVPGSVAARIRSRVALGSNQIDEGRFPKVGDTYQSADYDSAENRVDIDVQGGVGSVRVISAAG